MIKLHQAKLSDTFDVLQVFNSALDKKRTYGDNSWGEGKFTSSEILPHIEAGELYIVIDSGDVTGAVVLLESDKNMWDAEGLDGTAIYIHRLSSTRRGLGAEMITAVEVIAKKKNKSYLRLDCGSDNKGLVRYYKNNGFSVVDRSVRKMRNVAFFQKELS